MHWLLNREVVIGLAVAGGAFSVIATGLRQRLGEARASVLSWAAYACMGGSMVLFVALGFMAHG